MYNLNTYNLSAYKVTEHNIGAVSFLSDRFLHVQTVYCAFDTEPCTTRWLDFYDMPLASFILVVTSWYWLRKIMPDLSFTCS